MLDIVLFEPEIPQNTGNIIRLAANTGSKLHLIEPLGFKLEDKKMKRAGLDYHEFAEIAVYDGWQDFKNNSEKNRRVLGLSTKGSKPYTSITFNTDDFVVFGSETRGLSDVTRDDIGQENIYRIPMIPGSRSLNLSNAVAIVVYQAWHQSKFAGAMTFDQ